jgi:phage-related protein (TIGR01555 family)
MSAEVVQLSLPLGDGLRNFVTGLGTRKDHTFGNQYFYVPMSMEQLDAAYAGDWLARKIIDIPPQDSTREWRTWQTDRAEQIYKIEKQFRVRSKVRKAQTLARLYGGAVIMIGDGASDAAIPLDMERFARGGLKYLHVFSRYELVSEEEDLDPKSPTYGKPLFYRLRTRNQSERIHRSRFVFFMGSDAPRSIETVNEGWGQSVLDSVLQAVTNMSSTAQNTASLVAEAKVDVIKIPNLMTYVSQPKTTALLIERFTLANTLKSNHNALLLGGDEDFQRKQVTFAGLPDVMREQMQLASAAADIPMTRLMSQSPAGMNATGDSDIRNYYDKIRAFQTTDLEEDLILLDDVLVRHVFGDRQDDDTYEWNELWQMSEDERSQIALRNAQALQIYNTSNLFAPEELRPATADMIIDSGFLPTLDQHLLQQEDFDALLEEQQAEQEAAAQAAAAAQAQAAGGNTGGTAGGGRPNLRVVGGRGATDTLHALKDAEPRTLYIRRDVKNAGEIARWAKAQGFSKGALKASELHVTVIFSRTPVDWFDMGSSFSDEVKIKGGPRQLERLGEGKDAVVLLIPNTYELKYRHEELKEKGCSWDWPEYQPHITIAYDAEQTIDLNEVEPYQGEIVLGPEVFEEVDENWKARVTNKDSVEKDSAEARRQRARPFDTGFGERGQSDAGFSGIAPQFEEHEHPRDPSGKFAHKGGQSFAQKWENKKTGEKLVAYQPAATPVELAARITKVLKKGVSAHPPYRWRINKMIEQVHEFHEHQSSFQEQTSNIDKLVATLPLLKAKIAESFAEQAKALHAKGEGEKAVKLALKAMELGYSVPLEPITAPASVESLAAPAKAAEAAAMAAGKKYYEEWTEENPDANNPSWEKLDPASKAFWANSAKAESGEPKATEAASGSTIESADHWVKIGPQKGSNPGGLYQDEKGAKWYVKKPATAEHIAQDLLANKLYDAAGVDVPYEKSVMLGGSLSIASSIVENAKPLNEVGSVVAEQTQKDLRRGFAVDAWLANWDVVGLTKDNVLVMNESWLPIRVDTGGTLEFRAQGDKKEFGAEVKEWDTLRDPKLNPNSAEVFKDLTKQEMMAYIKPVAGITDTAIVNAVKESGASSHLADVLIARKNWLINKAIELQATAEATKASLTQAAPVAKPGTAPLDPVNLTPDQIKAKKTTPYPTPTLGGDPQGQAVASGLVTKFNEKYSGKEPQTVEELNAKIDAHKALKQQLDALKLTAQAKAQHSAAEQAKQAIASQVASLNLSQEDQAHLEVLSGIVGGDNVSYYIGTEQKQAATKVGLSVAEVALISAYTGSHYGPVNAQLRSGAITKQNYAYANRLDKALRKLPASKGTTYRKANLPADVAAKYKPGMIIAERAFTSSSKQSHIWHGEYRYEIEGKSGRDVQNISTHKSEAEVLFPMNTHFEVISVSGKTIKMKEIDEEDL